MARIIWSKNAKNNLKDINKTISLSSKYYANKFLKAIVDYTEILLKQPLIGKIYHQENYIYRRVIYKRYIIIYRVIDNEDILITGVLNQSRDIYFYDFESE